MQPGHVLICITNTHYIYKLGMIHVKIIMALEGLLLK